MQLPDGLEAVLALHRPDEAAVEETFVNRNAVSTLRLGQARGVALLVPARAGLPVAEYPPNLVKKTVVGAGHAAKEQVQMMVRRAAARRALGLAPMPPTRSPSPSAMRIIAAPRRWRRAPPAEQRA